VVDATVRVPLDRLHGEWVYKDAPFKIGAPLMFETRSMSFTVKSST